MKIVKTLALMAGLSTFFALPAYADGLIDQVNGITFDNKGHPYRFNGLQIDREGKVVKLLSKNDKRPSSPDFYLNGQNKTLIPGFVEAHSHVMALGEQALELDLSDSHSLAEAQEKLKKFADEHPSARWILGSGWNEQIWHSPTMPQASDIDKIVNDRPVWLLRSDGDIGWANSLALEKAQIKPAQNADKSSPIGILTGDFITRMKQAIPPLQPVDRDAAFLKAQKIFLERGITTVTDMGSSVDDWNIMRRMGDMGRLRLRIKSYAQGLEPLLSIAGKYPTALLYNGHLSMSGVTFSIDGNIVSRHAWLKQAYADSNQQGSDNLNDAKLRNLMSRAAMDGFQVAVQASGDAANNQLLNAIDELSESYKGDRRWRMEDASLIDSEDFKRLSKYDLVVSMQPSSYFTDKSVIEQRIGANRLSEIEAWDTLIDHSVPVTFGAIAASPFETMADILDRQDSHPDQKDKKINRESLFAYYTIQPAYASFSEKQVGRLMAGYYADFIFVDRDPLTVDNNALRQTKILETWVGGRQAWSQNSNK